MTPQDAVNIVERDTSTPNGPGDTFFGYGVIGVPFRSGHALALRRFCASSLGPAYTSIWHRDPAGRWTFYSTAAPDRSCARYFGAQVARNVTTPIRLEWTSAWTFEVNVGVELAWQVTLRSSPITRLLNWIGPLMPERAWQMPAVLRTASLAADAAFGTGRMNLTGRTPNGYRFVMSPRQLWVIDASTARVCGQHVGPMSPLGQQATLEDMRIPQRGLFAVAAAHLERPRHGDVRAPSYGKPCGQATTYTT